MYLSFWCYIIPPHKKHYRKADCRGYIRLKTEATTHELQKPRFSDSLILTIFSGSATSSGTPTNTPTIRAVSTAAFLVQVAKTTICKAVDIVRRLDGTGQAQKLAGSCLENGEPGLRVGRCHLLTIH
jgi:hypothetical protein